MRSIRRQRRLAVTATAWDDEDDANDEDDDGLDDVIFVD